MTDDFKIEKGIPLPEKKTAKNSKAYEFIKSLEVGDSFVVKKDKSGRPLESKANSYVQVGKKLGKKLVTRKIYSEENRLGSKHQRGALLVGPELDLFQQRSLFHPAQGGVAHHRSH